MTTKILPAPVLGGWFTTYSGNKFYLLNPRPEDVKIEDIAHALSMVCRYGGHCKEHYSVAQHSLLCRVRASELWPDNPLIQMHALLHDASEAYIGDMVRPMKETMPEFNDLEDRTQIAIYKGLGIPFPTLGDFEKVKRVDNELLLAERRDILNHGNHVWNIPATPWHGQIYPISPDVAEQIFLSSYAFLKATLHGVVSA